jgi:hypothetical protein
LKHLAEDNRETRKKLFDLGVKFAGLEGRMAGLEGRMAGIEGRLSQIPTVSQSIAILATLLIGMSGVLFTASRLFHP